MLDADSADRPPAGAIDASLLAGAAAIDQAAAALEHPVPGAVPGGPAVPAPLDWNAQARDLIDFAAELCIPIWPRLATVWDADRKGKLELRLARVMQKYNLTDEVLGKWAPEIMLAIVVVPATMPTFQAIAQDNAEAKAKAIAAAKAAPPPGQASAPPPAAPPAGSPIATPPPPPDTANLHSKV